MKTADRAHQDKLLIPGIIRLTRLPNLIIIALAQYGTAVFLIARPDNWFQYVKDFHLLLLSVSTVLIAAAGYIINDYYDIKIDFINKPDRVVVGKLVRRRKVIMAHTVLNVLGVLIGFYLSLAVGIINFMAAFLLWFYSNQLKRLPFIGNFCIAFLTGLAITVVSVYYHANYLLVNYYALFAFSISLVREIIKDIEDLKGDATFGCRTLPIIWGIPRTKFLLYGLTALFTCLLFLVSGILGNWLLVIYFFTLMIPVTVFLARLIRADTRRDFALLSSLCKLIMLGGILSMGFF